MSNRDNITNDVENTILIEDAADSSDDFAKLSQEVLNEKAQSALNSRDLSTTKFKALGMSEQDYNEFNDTPKATQQANITSSADEVTIPEVEEEIEVVVDEWRESQGLSGLKGVHTEQVTEPSIAVSIPTQSNNGSSPANPVNGTPNANAPASSGFNAPLPGKGGGVMGFLRPGGNWNKRALVASFLICIFVFGYYFNNSISGKGKDKAGDKTKALATRPEEVRSRINNTDLSPSELHPVSESYNEGKNMPTLKIPEGTPTPMPTPINVAKPVATPIATPTPVKLEVEQKDFGIALRAGELASLQKKTDTKAEAPKEKVVSLKGLRISMILLEPFRSGITSPITAQVTSSVKDATGKVIIPAYSTVQIPFNAVEVNGRVVNDTAANTLVKLPNGEEITIKGFVKGADGYAGLAGKVKGKKSNILVRTGRASLKALGAIVGIQSGGIGGAVATESINQSVDTTLPYIPSERVVEIAAGTQFTFNVLN